MKKKGKERREGKEGRSRKEGQGRKEGSSRKEGRRRRVGTIVLFKDAHLRLGSPVSQIVNMLQTLVLALPVMISATMLSG